MSGVSARGAVEWEEHVEREQSRYEDGIARMAPEQLVRLGNAAYGAGLALLMLDRRGEASVWLDRAAVRWRESWEHAPAASWGRPLGSIKAALIGGRDADAAGHADWALGLGVLEAGSPIGRYAGVLALLVLDRDREAAAVAEALRGRDDFPDDVASALECLATLDRNGYAAAIDSVLGSFESREGYLEDVPVADTVIALQRLAARRELAADLRPSALLPA